MIIDIHDLNVRRGGFSLTVPRFTVQPGEIVGVVGPNGAGKTTLLECLAGLLPRDSGQVSVLGKDPAKDPVAVRSQTGFVAPNQPVFDLRIGELLKLVSGYYRTWDHALAETIRDRFELDPNQRSSRLSLGQGTRLRILLAMAFRPKLLLLDEPASGLDLSARRALMTMVLEFVEGGDTAILLSSHRLGDVERLSERLLVIERGNVVRNGTTDELVGDERTLEEALLSWGAA
jgi:ABC-2 type transport system ATP-binding protein